MTCINLLLQRAEGPLVTQLLYRRPQVQGRGNVHAALAHLRRVTPAGGQLSLECISHVRLLQSEPALHFVVVLSCLSLVAAIRAKPMYVCMDASMAGGTHGRRCDMSYVSYLHEGMFFDVVDCGYACPSTYKDRNSSFPSSFFRKSFQTCLPHIFLQSFHFSL